MMVSIASSLAVRLCRGCVYTPPRGAANASSSFSWLHRKPQTCSFFRATVAAFASRKDIEGKLKQAIEVRARKKLLPSHGNGSIAIKRMVPEKQPRELRPNAEGGLHRSSAAPR